MTSQNSSSTSNLSSEIDSDAAMRSFSEYESGELSSMNSSNTSPESSFINPVTKLVHEALLHRANYNCSYAAVSDICDKINAVPGAAVEIPSGKAQLKQEVNLVYNYTHYVLCKICSILVKVGEVCHACKIETKKKKDNYFIYIPLKQQIYRSLKMYLNEILANSNSNNYDSHEINDICQSKMYRKCQSVTKEKVLSLTLNTDGAKIFNSSKSSLWPIQLVQNYLPPNIRFRRENILLVGLFCGKEKPNLPDILLPLAEEMQTLQKNGVSVWHNDDLLSFAVRILFCSCDSPARASLQNVKSHGGFFGCPCCEQRGTSVKNLKTGQSYVRFLKQSEPSPLRSHAGILQICDEIIKKGNVIDIKGIKGVSPMIAFKDFDLSAGFVVDWMHSTALGVMKLLLDIWLGKRKLFYEEDENYRFKALTTARRLQLDKRLLALKPPTRIKRKPRSMLDQSFFTANEYRSLLWFYLKYALRGLLDAQLITHFDLLSKATYKLCSTRITLPEIEDASEMLNRFCNEFEHYYGKNAITLNVHLLRHYGDVVVNTGPLWCHSLFTFESNIGELKKMFCSTVDVAEQIAFNYCLKRSEKKNSLLPVNIRILRPKQRNVTADVQELLLADFNLQQPKYTVGFQLLWKKNEIIKSISSAKTKSIDYFIELNDGTVGMVTLFVEINSKSYVVVQIYKIDHRENAENHHLREVVQSEEIKLFDCNDIRRKLIYLKFSYANIYFKEIICSEPNPFEGT